MANTQVKLNCQQCNSKFSVQYYRRHKARFCSTRCWHDSLKGKPFGNTLLLPKQRVTRKGVKFTPEQIKKLRLSHTGKCGELSSNWKGGVSKDPEHLKKLWKKNYVKNYDKRIFHNGRRRVMKLQAEGSHTKQEWEEMKIKYNHTCLSCEKGEPEIKLTQDHIIPLSKGGTDYIENIQPLCVSCNCSKGTKAISLIN